MREVGDIAAQEVTANLSWVGRLMERFETPEEKTALLEQLRGHFLNKIRVATLVLARLEELR